MSLIRPRRAPQAGHEARNGWDWYLQQFGFGGSTYATTGVQTLYGTTPAEPIPTNFVGYVLNGLFGNGIISTVELLRFSVFAEARFMWQKMIEGRPGDLHWSQALDELDTPFEGGTTGDLTGRMLLDADFAGNSYTVRGDGEIIRLRPDWCEIVLGARDLARGPKGQLVPVGVKKLGLMYTDGGEGSGNEPAFFLPGEFAHFAPMPDPLATYRGMSWLTPVLREIQNDGLAEQHKGKFFENGATPNLAVSFKSEMDPDKFEKFVELMEKQHAGVKNAYRTLYTAHGADVTVVGADMQQVDFKSTQGSGETRIANAAGIHPVVAGLSEGMQGSSLNAGNYAAAKRSTVDRTFRPLWRNVCGSLKTLFPPPRGSRLWYDSRDIAFLRDDTKDVADIQKSEAATIRQLLDAGFTPDSVTAAVTANDWALLTHSGLYSVQLQPAGSKNDSTGDPDATAEPDPADTGDDTTDPTNAPES